MNDALRQHARPVRRPIAIRRGAAIAAFSLASGAAHGAACPADPAAPPETLLSVRLAAQPPIRLDRRAIATDGYRAVFSWGELFKTDAAEQVLVITAQDGQPLTLAEGPLALRALADRRPGPRHVRNLCAIVARALPPADR